MNLPFEKHALSLALGLSTLLLAACGQDTTEPATETAAPATATAVPAVAENNDDIGGTVMGPAGPEAGVWVIAETEDLDTRYLKIVVTDDNGAFLIPDLPDAGYQVWVRGYGLDDSVKVAATPGT